MTHALFLFGGACAVFYSLACHNMSKIVFGSRIAFACTARCRRRIGCRLHRLLSPADWLSPILNRRVENNGFEPLTPCLQSRCSSQLS